MSVKTDGIAPGDPPLIDPTVLTTQAQARDREMLLRQMDDLRELLILQNNKTEGAAALRDQIIETRLDAMDRARELTQANTDRLPSDIDEKVGALRQIMDEKFRSVGNQFAERDTRDERSSRDTKTAVDAALSAAKEAVGAQNASSALAIAKSETATDKRIDQQGHLIATAIKALDDKIDDLKERLTRIEGKDEGSVKTVATAQSSNTLAIAIVGACIAFVVGVVGIAGFVYSVIRPH